MQHIYFCGLKGMMPGAKPLLPGAPYYFVVSWSPNDHSSDRQGSTTNLLSSAGIQEMLERVAKEKGLDWDEFFGKLKKNEQWHVEVY